MRGKEKIVFLPRISLLPCCVMVAPQILVLFVWADIAIEGKTLWIATNFGLIKYEP